jgi:hypothetical protein
MRSSRPFSRIALVTVAALSISRAADAQTRLGAHFGFALPLVSHGDGETTTIGDDFVFAVPMGITVKKSDLFAFDLEFAPVVQNDPRKIDLTLHPGIAWNLGGGYSAGTRLAFDIGKESWGFTPLFNRGLFQAPGDTMIFGEVDIPIRFKEADGRQFTSVGLTVVFGAAF